MIKKEYIIRPTLEIRVTEDDINDILFTALNGGIDHWCREVVEVGELKGADVCEQITRGGKLGFVSGMDGEAREMTLPVFLLGMRRWLESGCQVAIEGNRIVTYEEIGEDEADAIIQFALFGEYNWRR